MKCRFFGCDDIATDTGYCKGCNDGIKFSSMGAINLERDATKRECVCQGPGYFWPMDGDKTQDDGTLRTFITGATRDTSTDKLEPYGFLSPQALMRFSEYMHRHRKQSNGNLRASNNWKSGFPRNAYKHSLTRHFFDWWVGSTGKFARPYDEEEVLCAILFNVQGLLHELLLGRDVEE